MILNLTHKMIDNKSVFLFLFTLYSPYLKCQIDPLGKAMDFRVITTAVPFLSINTSAQAMGSGCVGVVASDLYMQNGLDQNPALLSRGKKVLGFQAINVVPWLRGLGVNDVFLAETGCHYSLNNNNAVGFSAKHFNLGAIQMTDQAGQAYRSLNPNEFAIGLKYAHNFSAGFSIGGGIKYVYSDLLGNGASGTGHAKVGQALAGDFGFDFRRNLVQTDDFLLRWNAGLSFLNLGNKISYTDDHRDDFIPQAMKIGSLFTVRNKLLNQDFIEFDFSYQADKLLVPTPSTSGPIFGWMNQNISPLQGAVQSFYDAPGGMEEEMREIIHQFGTESRLILADNRIIIALRGGYFYEHATKGNRKFSTLGCGLGICGFRFDFAYWIPDQANHPLEKTYAINFGGRFNLDKDNFFRFIE